MILLFNVKISNSPLLKYHRHEWLPVYLRTDVFRYSLASYSCLRHLISKAIFYIELAPEFEHEKEKLENFILELYPDACIHWYRNQYPAQWREACEKEIFIGKDDIIWYCGNDDHIFIDYDTSLVEEGLRLLESDPDPLASLYYSHWPEICLLSHHHNGELTKSKNYTKFKWRAFDSIRAIKVSSFMHYWFDYKDQEHFEYIRFFRTDVFNDFLGVVPAGATMYAPTRELVRHYDGYSHFPTAGDIANIVPPLFIPPGFFDKKIKIRIGYPNREAGWTNLNPAAEYLYAANIEGTDYRWTLDDIPVFWKNRISEIKINTDVNLDSLTLARDKAFISTTQMLMYTKYLAEPVPPPIHYYDNHLKHGKN